MDLRLRARIQNPDPSCKPFFAFSSCRPCVLVCSGRKCIEYHFPACTISSTYRLPSNVSALVYSTALRGYVVVLENSNLQVYRELSTAGIVLISTQTIPGETSRSIRMLTSNISPDKAILIFVKEGSPSVWCMQLDTSDASVMASYKLRADIEGQQESVSVVRGSTATVASQFAIKNYDKVTSVVALDCHASRGFVAAAYTNGIIRVWDYHRKEVKNLCDVQLLRNEAITAIKFHPHFEILLATTSHGRIFSFNLQGVYHEKGSPPLIASARTKENTYFKAICFQNVLTSHSVESQGGEAGVNGSYAFLLTGLNRIYIQKISSDGKIFPSSIYNAVSKPLVVEKENDLNIGVLQCDPLFGCIAAIVKNSRDILIYDRYIMKTVFPFKPITEGNDLPFSTIPGQALEGTPLADSNVLFISKGVLFQYYFIEDIVTELCALPHGIPLHLRASRDEKGDLIAVLVVMLIEENAVDPLEKGEEAVGLAYVICSKRKEGEQWNVSEPQFGRDATFVGSKNNSKSIAIISKSGKAISVVSFGIEKNVARGVQRFRVSEGKIKRCFACPLGDSESLVYWDSANFRLVFSKNARYMADGKFDYDVDVDISFRVEEDEHVIDVRWQEIPTGGRSKTTQFLGFILTSKRVAIFRNALENLVVFYLKELRKLEKDFALPQAIWCGPCVCLLLGSYVYSITLDGHADLLVCLGHSEHVGTLLTILPDRVLYLSTATAQKRFRINSRPISIIQILIRGLLALPSPSGPSGYIEKIRNIMKSRDMTQISSKTVSDLLHKDCEMIAKAIATSEESSLIMPRLSLGLLLLEMRELRLALLCFEDEYSLLPNVKDSFNSNCELYRTFQLLFNHAILRQDFRVAHRCSQILGREGTFRSFIDREGGYAALSMITKFASAKGHTVISSKLQPLLEQSHRSSKAVTSIKSSVNPIKNIDCIMGMTDHAPVQALQNGQTQLLSPLDSSGVDKRLRSLDTSDFLVLRNDFDGTGGDQYQIQNFNEAQFAEENSMNMDGMDGMDRGYGGVGAGQGVMDVGEVMIECHNLIDKGQLADALKSIDTVIKMLTVNGAIDRGSLPKLQVAVSYKLLIRSLMRIGEIRGQMNQLKNPQDMVRPKLNIAHLSTALTSLPFRPPHRFKMISLAINSNFEVGNFATAARGIQLLESQKLSEITLELQQKYAMCRSCGFQDREPVQFQNICYQTLTLIAPKVSLLKCNTCPAAYSLRSGLGAGQPCLYCLIGRVV